MQPAWIMESQIRTRIRLLSSWTSCVAASAVHSLCSWSNLQFPTGDILICRVSSFLMFHAHTQPGLLWWSNMAMEKKKHLVRWFSHEKLNFEIFPASHGWFWRYIFGPSLGKTWAPFPRRATCIWCCAEFWHRFQEHRDLAPWREVNRKVTNMSLVYW